MYQVELTAAERDIVIDELAALIMGCDDEETVATARGVIDKLA
jgi:hypothetical protein